MKKSIISVILSLFILIAVLSCNKDDENIYATNEDIELLNVKYGNDPLQAMDVFLPAGRSAANTKFVVFIHGGGWSGGDKGDFGINSETVKALKEQFPGFALININYRLVTATTNKYPTAEKDVEAAMNYIWNHLNDYQISSRAYLLGGSAGAHLAALHTLKHNQNNNIKGCIAISGAYNMVSTYNQSGAETKQYVEAFLGGKPTEVADVYNAASPVNFITNTSAKFLILHGNGDPLIGVSQAAELKAALEGKNVPVTYFTYSGGHGIPPEHMEEAMTRIKTFLTQ